MSPATRNLLLLVATVLPPTGAGLFRVWVYQDAVQLGYRLSETEEQRKRLDNTLRQLEVELAAERSPARLAEVGRRLSLARPAASQLVKGGPRPNAKTAPAGGDHGRP